MMIECRARTPRTQVQYRPAHGRSIAIAIALLIGFITAVPHAAAASIALHQDFVTASIVKRLFAENGRRLLTGSVQSCNYAYVEQPKVTLRDGRLFLRMRLVGHAGVSVRGSCAGAGDAFYTTVSGQPVVTADTITLRDFRMEEGREMYRGLLDPLLRRQIPALLGMNLREELTRLVQTNVAAARVTLTQFQLLDATARDGVLTVRFDFSLLANVP